jgi:leucyl-tRNA synthetase
MEKFKHREIESKWQAKWEASHIFTTPQLKKGDQKAYILDMFPYPSGSGLHVGHILGYTGSDIFARYSRMSGKKVLHPIGWDAFGLPAENFAIKSGVHPAISTGKNIKEYQRQLKQAGFSYDWDKEINTSEPDYYKWTQWIFKVLYEKGLAFRKEGIVNWCPGCQTVLANEQVVAGECERCGSKVIQKNLKQWYFKITDYAERLLNDLDQLDWPERIKTMQRNWIGKSEGASLNFQVQDTKLKINVFTTRPDTVFGATYLVLAPENPLIEQIVTERQKPVVEHYQKETAQKNELERTFLEKEKTGVFTGAYAINPASQELIPIWIADYVIQSYGTGAIMAVPAHDERDFAFAQKFNLPVKQVIVGKSLPWTEKGDLLNSGQYNGPATPEKIQQMVHLLGGELKTTYRLRDWLVSRQRFWGAPIPIIYDQNGQEKILPVSQLPVTLPMDIEFLPTGQSPLNLAKEWKNIHYQGKEYTREVDTLDTFVCSSWYFLRYPNPQIQTAAFDLEQVKQWLPVDIYVGGAEHAVLHLLYARFICKVLFDAGYLDFEEPFLSLHNQGTILGPDHNKMSKSKGNVINPDQVIAEYGADALRLYEMFMAPFELEKPWSTEGLNGVRRFLDKVWRLQEKVEATPSQLPVIKILNQTIQKVTEDLENFKFNTCISSLMEATNLMTEQKSISKESYLTLIILLNPFAPFLTEEIWEKFNQKGFCSLAAWPTFDQKYLLEEELELPIQINGKVRAKIKVKRGTKEKDLLEMAKAEPKIQSYLVGNKISKSIIIVDRMISLVVS